MSEVPPFRRHRRIRAPQVRVKVRYPGAERLWELYLKDISKGGLFIRTDVIKPLGTRVAVWLDVQADEPLELEGEVVRVVHPEQATLDQPAGMGVQFFEPHESSRRVLDALLRRLGEGEALAGGWPRKMRGSDAFEQAEIALAEGRLDEALAAYKLAVEMDPHNPRFAARLAQVQGKPGR